MGIKINIYKLVEFSFISCICFDKNPYQHYYYTQIELLEGQLIIAVVFLEKLSSFRKIYLIKGHLSDDMVEL